MNISILTFSVVLWDMHFFLWRIGLSWKSNLQKILRLNGRFQESFYVFCENVVGRSDNVRCAEGCVILIDAAAFPFILKSPIFLFFQKRQDIWEKLEINPTEWKCTERKDTRYTEEDFIYLPTLNVSVFRPLSSRVSY